MRKEMRKYSRFFSLPPSLNSDRLVRSSPPPLESSVALQGLPFCILSDTTAGGQQSQENVTQKTAGPECYLFSRKGAMKWLCSGKVLWGHSEAEWVHFNCICNLRVCFQLVPAGPSLWACVNIIIFSVAHSWTARGCACGLGRLLLDRGIVWVSRFSSFMFS